MSQLLSSPFFLVVDLQRSFHWFQKRSLFLIKPRLHWVNSLKSLLDFLTCKIAWLPLCYFNFLQLLLKKIILETILAVIWPNTLSFCNILRNDKKHGRNKRVKGKLAVKISILLLWLKDFRISSFPFINILLNRVEF